MRRLTALGAVLAFGTGCAGTIGHSLHVYGYMDQIESVGTKVEVEETEDVILGFIYDTDYVDRARERLLAECPDGELVNIKVRFSTDMGFLAYRQKVWMGGECVASGA